MNNSATDLQSGRFSTEQRVSSQNLVPVPFAFAIGIVALLFAMLNEANTVPTGTCVWLYAISLAATSAAAVCFTYAFQQGEIVARILTTICLLPVLWNALNLLWAIGGELKLLRV